MQGAFPSQKIKELITGGAIVNANITNVQPASLDLTISEEIYRVDALFLPRVGETVRHAMEKVNPLKFNHDNVFEVGVPYLVRLNEVLALPSDVYAYMNPKSTTGRNDVKVSVIADGISRFDSAGISGYRGELWAFIEPKSFRIRLAPNEALIQIRFFNSDTRIREKDLPLFYESEKILYNSEGKEIPYDKLKISDRDGGLILTVDLDSDMIGWCCQGSRNVLDFSKRNFYNPNDFFEPLKRPSKGMLFLRRGSFYIFYTKQYVRVPAGFTCEMAPVDIRNGEYRSHYAGYIDPGWGWGENGEILGRPLVLEVRPFDDNILLYDNQPVCKLIFERMLEKPEMLYGEKAQSNYFSQQGPVLSKHFKRSNSYDISRESFSAG